MATKPFLETLVNAINGELEQDSAHLADAISGELDPGYTNPGATKYLAWWRSNWADVQWRQEQLDRVGPQAFYDTTYAAFNMEDQKPDLKKLSNVDVQPEHMHPNNALLPNEVAPTPDVNLSGQSAQPRAVQANPVVQPATEPSEPSQPVMGLSGPGT